MNYKRIYDRLISYRKTNVLKKRDEVYSELHHVLPRSLGGSNKKENLVRLTGREHFVAHLLLVEIHRGNTHYLHKMLNAIIFFTSRNKKEHNVDVKNSRIYHMLRDEFSKSQSIKVLGKNNPNYGKMWITNGIENMKVFKYETLQYGWFIGMNANDGTAKTRRNNKRPIVLSNFNVYKSLDYNFSDFVNQTSYTYDKKVLHRSFSMYVDGWDEIRSLIRAKKHNYPKIRKIRTFLKPSLASYR